MCDPGNEAMPMLHDGYLKLYQLSAPRLDYDTILFDEAQDANPVTLAIIRQQSCAKVFVGDPHQQIYQFRYAENAMADPSLTDELFLTESFRFGDEIAAAANRLLAVKREGNAVRGGRRVPPSSTKACIARGNAALYRRAALLAQQGGNICWVGGSMAIASIFSTTSGSLRPGDIQRSKIASWRVFRISTRCRAMPPPRTSAISRHGSE